MIVRATDSDGDFIFGSGKNNYRKGNAAIAQLIRSNLLMFLGECFFDIYAGLDWFNLLGNKNQLALEIAVNATILNTYGVTSVTKLSAVLSASRNLTITYTCSTIFPGGVSASVGLLLDELGNILTDESGDPLHG